VDLEPLAAHVDSEKVNKTTSKGDAWIRKSSMSLLTQTKSMKTDAVTTGKSSPKYLPKVTPGFESARRPY